MTSRVVGRGAFLHIPKTGGTWVQNVLNKANLIKGPIGHEHNWSHREQWAFCVVRDPVTWWISMWQHQMDTRWAHFNGGEAHPLHPISGLYEVELHRWIDRAANEYAGFCGRLYEQFTDNAKFVLKMEQLSTQMQILAETVGWPELDTTLPKANTSKMIVDMAGIDLTPLYAAERDAVKIWRMAGLEPVCNFVI